LTYEVVIQLKANGQRKQFAREDPEGMRAVRSAIGDLAEDPYPATSFPPGRVSERRLTVGRYRVWYVVEGQRVFVRRIGKAPGPD
jgi:mRNA interferase RelE/StbE